MRRVIAGPAYFEGKYSVDDRGCWIWQKGVANGYGMARRPGKNVKAHRLAYEYFIGPIPEGLTIDHLCRQPLCVNPAHLEAVDIRTNILRSPIALAAVNSRKTHCIRGHEFTAANIRWVSAGPRMGRQCRICDNGKLHKKAA
jgi:hypothetical protein